MNGYADQISWNTAQVYTINLAILLTQTLFPRGAKHFYNDMIIFIGINWNCYRAHYDGGNIYLDILFSITLIIILLYIGKGMLHKGGLY